MISFQDWNGSTRWYNVIFGAVQVRLERIYIKGKWTPFCYLKNMNIISNKEWDELSKEEMK